MIVVDSVEDLEVASENDIAMARQRAREVGLAQGLDPFAAAAITTATSELSRNILVHAGKGVVRIERVRNDRTTGVRATFSDWGPGILDVEGALRGGKSTVRSLGLGLSGSVRLVDAFDIDSAPGKGTRITVTKWKRTF